MLVNSARKNKKKNKGVEGKKSSGESSCVVSQTVALRNTGGRSGLQNGQNGRNVQGFLGSDEQWVGSFSAFTAIILDFYF